MTVLRSSGRHRDKTHPDWKSRYEEEKKLVASLTQALITRDAELAQERADREAAVEYMGERIAGLEEALRLAEAANEASRRAVRVEAGVRDTRDPRDRATEPLDLRQVQREVSDDYLDRTRATWHSPVTTLHQALAQPVVADPDAETITIRRPSWATPATA